MTTKTKSSSVKKHRPSAASKKFKVSKSGSKTTATKVADVDSLDLSDIVSAAYNSGKEKKNKGLSSLTVKSLKQDQKKDQEKKEVENKQSTEAQSMIDMLDLM